MTLTATQGSGVALLRGMRDLLALRMPPILTELATAYTLTLPSPASVYVGQMPDLLGDWPQVGVMVEASTLESMVSPCYRADHTVVLTVTAAEGYFGAATPGEMHLATVAYVEAAARALAKWVTSDLGALAVYKAEIVEMTAQDSPYTVTADSGESWTVRVAVARVRVHQEIAKEET
jgi:hypothetical protein